MATRIIEAVYSGGLLHPTEPLPLADGEHVTLAILSERERVEAALAPILVQRAAPSPDEEPLDTEAILRHLHEVSRGLPSVSELIIEERRNGP
jgi:predicted DNA-binding antitoxin AbrB/MazE fold protein